MAYRYNSVHRYTGIQVQQRTQIHWHTGTTAYTGTMAYRYNSLHCLWYFYATRSSDRNTTCKMPLQQSWKPFWGPAGNENKRRTWPSKHKTPPVNLRFKMEWAKNYDMLKYWIQFRCGAFFQIHTTYNIQLNFIHRLCSPALNPAFPSSEATVIGADFVGSERLEPLPPLIFWLWAHPATNPIIHIFVSQNAFHCVKK